MSQRPSPVRLAVRLMYAGAALAVFRSFLGLLPNSSEPGAPPVEPPVTTGETVAAIVVTVVVGLLTASLWLWLATMIGRGANWARVTGSVLGALAICVGLLNLTGQGLGSSSGVPLAAVTGSIGVVLAVTIIVLLWLPVSSAFFTTTPVIEEPPYPPLA